MSSNSLATQACPICGESHSGSTQLCDKHSTLFQKGFICLVAIEPHNNIDSDSLSEHEVTRTGETLHMQREHFDEMLDHNVPEDVPYIYTDPELIGYIQSLETINSPTLLH